MINLVIVFCLIKINFTLNEVIKKKCSLKKVLNNTINGIAQLNNTQSNDGNEFYICPNENYTYEYTTCCNVRECCTSKELLSKQAMNSQNLDKLILVSIILIILIFITIILVCCFWSKCPLYNLFIIRYYIDESEYANKLETAENSIDVMPGDGSFNGNTVHTLNKINFNYFSGNKSSRNSVEPTKFIKKNLNEI